MDNDIQKIKEAIEEHKAEIRRLKAIIAENKKVVKPKYDLEADKRKFWNSRPQDRTDPFSDWELVYWASFLLANTSRREKLTSTGEVAKRAKRIRELIQYYKEQYPIDGDPANADKLAREQVKDYLHYVLWYVPTWISKDGPVPMTFYVATSDWAVNNYAAKVFTFRQEKQLKELMKPFGEDD